jgi:dihydropyrimidinase
MEFELVVRGGTLLSACDKQAADIGIRDGKIEAIGQGLIGDKMVDASGLYVLPGGVDPHVHLQMPAGETTSSDDFGSGTIAAVMGGTTTIIDFVEPEAGESLKNAFEKRKAAAAGKAVIDYGFHMTLSSTRDDWMAEIPWMISTGVPSFKMYTTYDGMRLNDEEMLYAMQRVAAAGGLVLVHCENDAIVKASTQAQQSQGILSPAAHPLARPAQAEIEAVTRVLALADCANVPVYIVHISTAGGAGALRSALERGVQAWGETCPQYLLLTEELYFSHGFEGAKFVCSPPLRAQKDMRKLWWALDDNVVQSIGTDHCPFNYVGQKDLGREDFTRIPGGLPGIESRLSLIYSYGVRAGKMGLRQWVNTCCTQPAKIMGLYPRKGTLMPGADADIVVFDPKMKVRLSAEFLHERVDYSPYEGLELTGWPKLVFSRGECVVREGIFSGESGRGLFLPRKLGNQSGVWKN